MIPYLCFQICFVRNVFILNCEVDGKILIETLLMGRCLLMQNYIITNKDSLCKIRSRTEERVFLPFVRDRGTKSSLFIAPYRSLILLSPSWDTWVPVYPIRHHITEPRTLAKLAIAGFPPLSLVIFMAYAQSNYTQTKNDIVFPDKNLFFHLYLQFTSNCQNSRNCAWVTR